MGLPPIPTTKYLPATPSTLSHAILFGPELLDVNKVFSWHKQCARGLQDFGISKGELKVLLKKYNTMDDGDQIEYAECERQYGI